MRDQITGHYFLRTLIEKFHQEERGKGREDEEMWTKEEEYKTIIAECWENDQHLSNVGEVTNCLTRCASKLQGWGMKKFGNPTKEANEWHSKCALLRRSMSSQDGSKKLLEVEKLLD
ncbi:hypothetical protein TorRG33x02_055390 [Trema orientale]|uniref:Uncharacterized protein n=1 Tax=Trema orientale TaxID=63057 RepID=A0A2P5FLH9_TREOI|nr:hypothetical protein TorRG33x02_055390 [Trema orientale]